jgi:hypothetical protein
MATWNSSDVVLTLKGREILSKVQSGNGSITVTRIMTGAGYVPPAQLYLQTAVKDEKQETRIVKVDTMVGGSSVEVQFDNLDLEQPYDLYQLGIYVTHQDYDGEVLYLIAQCDTSSPDRIPLASDTPITVHYSLFMEHSNTDNVQINVNLAGIVYRPDFDALEERVDEHTADEGLHFTAGEKEKLARSTRVESSDNGSILIDGVKTTVYTHPDKHPASIITQDANNRFVTDAEKAAWNAKWDYNEETIKAVKVYNAVNADTVNGKTVAVDVPAGAKFTDTITTINGKTGAITKADIVALGIPGEVADRIAWDNVTGKPSTFPPSEHTHEELMPKTGGTFTGEVNMSSQNRIMLGGKFFIRHNSAQNALEIGVVS